MEKKIMLGNLLSQQIMGFLYVMLALSILLLFLGEHLAAILIFSLWLIIRFGSKKFLIINTVKNNFQLISSFLGFTLSKEIRELSDFPYLKIKKVQKLMRYSTYGTEGTYRTEVNSLILYDKKNKCSKVLIEGKGMEELQEIAIVLEIAGLERKD